MNENNEQEERFRHRIWTALRDIRLHQSNGQPNGFDSNASIEAELAELAAAPMDEVEVSRIMDQVHRSIAEAAKSRKGMVDMQNRTSLRNVASASNDRRSVSRRPQTGSAAIVAVVTTSLCLLTAYGLFQVASETVSDNRPFTPGTSLTDAIDPLSRSTHHFRYVAQPRPQAAPPERLVVGQTIRTAARERRRALLPDGSILYLNEQSTVALTANRTVALHRGQLFVEVTPANLSAQGPFVVETPDRAVTALGTKFAVSAGDKETEVLVTQGKVRVSGAAEIVTGGQVAATSEKDEDVIIDAAPRASQALSWTRELIAAAETPIVPRSEHDGGSLIVVDPSGQEMKLSLRKFHVDAHLEDGFARTTIDQTYFNHTHERQEGTFKFPLPPDASLSRLAMYVNGKLMEGGMVERDHGRNVFEQIMHTKRDPALLEWVDGSTFKMRVFPLEPRQEKRIILSYTQRLPNDYGRTEYRFPAGHSLDKVRDWSTSLTVVNGAGKTRWFSPTHLLKATDVDDDLVLEGDLQNAVLNKDLVVELTAVGTRSNDLSRQIKETVDFSGAQHEGFSYQMLRFRPDLSGEMKRPRRNWVFLYESSGDRNPLLARVQLDVISTMLEHAEHDDTFSIISAATRAESFRIKPVRCSKKNIEKAVAWLEDAHLVGALNLEEAFSKAKPFCQSNDDTLLVHVGSANPVLGERDEKKLLKFLPPDIEYVGVGVGKRWSRAFMKSAAGRTGGQFTQINPDEKVSWRAFELLSTLYAPRLIDLKVESGRKDVRFLTFTDTLAHGQEIAAIARLPLKAKPLDAVTVTGTLNGQRFTRKLSVKNVVPQADYLPRTWARLEIDRLVASGAEAHKDAIITLSKAMYVMSPFTSLLVLEDEAMYEQFNVDRGRKDHWALYPAPATIQVVHEPGPTLPKNVLPVDVLTQQLKSQSARVDVAKANYDLGIQDNRTPEELEKLKALLTDEEREREVLQNRLKLAEQAAGRESENVAKTVLFRRLPSITLPGFHVNGYPDRSLYFADSSWGRGQFNSVTPDDLISFGEPLLRNYWGFSPPGNYILGTNDNSEIASRRWFEGPGDGWFYDPAFSVNQGLDRYDAIDGEVSKVIVDRIRRYESAYRILARGEGVNRQIQSSVQPRSGTPLSFDFDINSNGLIDEGFLGRRPQILTGSRVASNQMGFLPALRDTSRLRYDDYSGVHVRFAQSGTERDFEFDRPEFWVEYGLVGQNFNSPQFDNYLTDLDEDGFILDDSLSLFNLRGFSRRFSHPVTFGRPHPYQARGRGESSQIRYVNVSVQRPGILRNILSYALGMQTSTADVLAVLDAESKSAAEPSRGSIDDAARRLIEDSRAAGWEKITISSSKNASEITLLCNGLGELRLERRTTDGLFEQVVSDGKILKHLYPELGIGAQRTVTRFHRRALLNMTPWLLPPVEDLAIGCDIRQVNESTIRITRLNTAKSDKQTTNDSQPAEKFELAIELVFSDDGRLTERRWIKLASKSEPAEQILWRHLYEASGNIRILDGDGKLVTELKLVRQPIVEQPVFPPTDGLVILPLPYRSADSYSLNLPAQPASNGSVDYSQLSEADAMKLVATHVATSDFDALWNVINQRFVAKDDCRMGFAVLLSGAATKNSQPIHEVVSRNQGSSALGSFLVQHFDWGNDQDMSKEFVLPDSASPFVRQLAEIHNLYALWSSGRATQDRTEAQVNKELSRAFEVIRRCPSKAVAWALLNVVHRSIDETFSKKKLHLRLAKEAASFEAEPGFFGPARLARVRWLISGEKTDEARSLYSSFRHDAAEAGIALPVSDEIRTAFKKVSGDYKVWSQLILESAAPLARQKRQLELLQLALNCAVIAEHDTARQLLDSVIKGADFRKRPDLLLIVLRCLMTIDDWGQAEDFARQLINYRNARENASLWRTASQIATALGNDDESLRRLEQAMRLEFSSLPDTVNVESLRAEYNKLFDRFAMFADKSLADGKALPKDFVERVTQMADAWRSIDPDPTVACQRAAKLLQLVGLYESAWDYWTTPLVNTANSSAAWTNLATALAETNQIHRASLAWSEAFAAEPTNPELLWNHASLLSNHNQPERAKKLLTQIMNGKWQPRFATYKSKAKSLLQQL
ncbi:MAG: VIT domain-containing protein [Planctomycetota bacterium]|nr:VIT domain-containing protein [Planctomycetota bacterium]